MSDTEATNEVEVLVRANLTIAGVLYPVGAVAKLKVDQEVRDCIAMKLVVERDETGGFPDLGWVGDRSAFTPGRGCCGG